MACSLRTRSAKTLTESMSTEEAYAERREDAGVRRARRLGERRGRRIGALPLWVHAGHCTDGMQAADGPRWAGS